MNSIGLLSTIYIIFVSIIIAVILLMLSYRIYFVFIKPSPRKPLFSSGVSVYVKLLKISFGASMLLIFITAPVYAYIGSAFKSIIPGALNHLLVFTIISLAGLEMYLCYSVSEKLLQKHFKKIMLSIVVLVMLPLSIYLSVFIPVLFEFPDEEESYLIEIPVRGTWMAGHAGGSEVMNYHNAVKAQQYAIDIVKVNEKGRFYKGKGEELEDVYSFGEPIYSPVEGVIVAVVDSLPNAGITLAPSDSLNPAGNHVAIQFEDERFLFLAHFDPYTIPLSQGDTVRTGDYLGNIGNSGNTSWPHLHMHIQDLPFIDNKNATGYPFRFQKMDRKRWLACSTIRGGFLIKNDYFRDHQTD